VKMLLYGLSAGVLFGFLMQRARVLRYDKQLGALRLIDMTIVKFMLSTVVVGTIGLHLLAGLDVVALSPKPGLVGANIIGGLLFGVGWALVGFCPGTSVGAVGEGRWHALWGILGMLVGAGLYAEAYPFLKRTVLGWGNLGKVRIPEVLHVSPWVVIVVFAILAVALCVWFEKKRL